jgi:hypothetical protein
MGKHHYKHEQIMKLLTILGGLVGIATMILGLAGIADIGFVNPLLGLNAVLNFIVGIVISVLTLLTGLKPNAPLPFHWLVLFILGVLLIVFGAGIWACALVIIAALIGLIEDL